MKKILSRKKKVKKRAPRKVTGNWTDEKVFKLISIVEQRPALWNVASTEYKVAKDQVMLFK